jgi:hypothetical protein
MAVDRRGLGAWAGLLGQPTPLCCAGLLGALAILTHANALVADDFRPSFPRPMEPLRLTPAADPKPLRPAAGVVGASAQEGESSAGSQSAAWRLRWRNPEAARSTADSVAERPLAVSKASMAWGGVRQADRYPVKQATQLAPVDPFDDPFGDDPPPAAGLGSPGEMRNVFQPAGEAEQPAAPGQPRSVPEYSPLRDERAPAPPSTALPQEKPPAASPLADPPADSPFGQPPDSFELRPVPDQPCDRIYNRRNCCVEDDRCRQARDYVRNDRITSISLDITPLFTNTDQATPTDVAMSRELANSPIRVWKDRAGQQVAEGQLVDYRNGRVYITNRHGETVKVPFKTLSDDDLCFVAAWWSLPTECPLGDEQFSQRNWLAMNMMWKASALCHKPLYFEDVQLERYGHTSGPLTEPIVSAAHFFGNLATLPYQMAMHPPQECQYSLGYYRPGSCAPWLVPPVPISWRGGLAQAGLIVGGIFIVP